MGRPKEDSPYKHEFCEQLIEHMGRGYSFDSFAAVIGVTQRKTFETLQEPKPMLATLSKRGQIRFLVYQEEISPKLFRDFLCSLIADVDKKIFLLVKKIVCLYLNSETESWLEEHQDRIEVIYLPV